MNDVKAENTEVTEDDVIDIAVEEAVSDKEPTEITVNYVAIPADQIKALIKRIDTTPFTGVGNVMLAADIVKVLGSGIVIPIKEK